jgi:hypothetical protein
MQRRLFHLEGPGIGGAAAPLEQLLRGLAACLEQLLRGLAACLVTPFLLLAMLVIGCWLRALGIKRPPDG